MNKKGISLIVLIITIVVIIILATAVIVTLARTNVIENATEAVKDVGESYEKATINTIVTGSNATINGKKPSTSNPVIPVGFKAVETDDATWTDANSDGKPDGWNDGLVIADDDGNEFVWVPVDGTTVPYAKNFTYPSFYGATSSNTSDVPASEMPTFPSGVDERTQITKYGGFYVGRYEAGKPSGVTNTSGKPVSKKDATVWTGINYTDSNARAQELYSSDTNVKSGLLTGTSWDTVCKWISNLGKSVVDSRTWGNHSDSESPANVEGAGTKQVTGFSEYWKAKNIYDFAGNTWEWTNEEACSTFRVRRGGNCDFSGGSSRYPESFRGSLTASNTNDLLGFRLMLYIM